VRPAVLVPGTAGWGGDAGGVLRAADGGDDREAGGGMSELARIEPKTATAEELLRFAVAVREQVDSMTEQQLDELEATLVAVEKRLQQLGKDAAEARKSRVITLLRIGELLGRGKPGRPKKTWDDDHNISWDDDHNTALTQTQRDRRKYARLLADFSDQVRAELADSKVVSLSRMVKICQRRRSARNAPPLERRYSILYVDPPWRYEGAESGNRQIENQYGTMALDDIKALKPPAADDAVLFFWVTSPKLADGLAVLRAWGFEYRTCMVWVKDKIGMGYYARQQHELLLVAKRGKPPVPEPANRPSSIIYGDRSEHSSKPPAVYDLIEAMYPEYDRTDELTDFCEMFARASHKGWANWGLDTSI
jgi:N6-adenosine-specific RNA methylase IME4